MNHSHDHHEHPSSLSLPPWHDSNTATARCRDVGAQGLFVLYECDTKHAMRRTLPKFDIDTIDTLNMMVWNMYLSFQIWLLWVSICYYRFFWGAEYVWRSNTYIYIFERVVVQVSAAHFSEAVSRNCSWNRFQMMNSKQIKLSSLRESDLKATGWNHGFFFGAISIFWWLQLG